MMLSLLRVVLALPIAVRCATTITLADVHLSGESTVIPRPSQTFSVVGVGSEGLATITFEFVESLQPTVTGFSTHINNGTRGVVEALFGTITIPPETIHGTMLADASHYAYTESLVATASTDKDVFMAKSCDFDGKGGGSCVERNWGGDFGGTLTVSWTGSVIPYRTEVFSGNSGARGGYETMPSFYILVGWSVVSMGVIFGFFLGL
ncbi:hypothetical protein BDZ94DRAFT_1263405 [Collybia nuda]|uniref:Uncharacterized protein n=1 Tax=Collybia nuda TaxID=64659 RepID=A0A9P5Y3G0_9AGAR|nr:hypothetical protein BDZ94DRAFT_1263405 [Collybia nuda]